MHIYIYLSPTVNWDFTKGPTETTYTIYMRPDRSQCDMQYTWCCLGINHNKFIPSRRRFFLPSVPWSSPKVPVVSTRSQADLLSLIQKQKGESPAPIPYPYQPGRVKGVKEKKRKSGGNHAIFHSLSLFFSRQKLTHDSYVQDVDDNGDERQE